MKNEMTFQGFEDFSKGTMGNAGQNLYVSKKGVLQRIFRFDTTGNGFFDIMITNSHDYNEHPRLQIISDCLGGNPRISHVLTDGAHCAAIADLNKDGYDDLVITAYNNGHHSDLAAYVYYGGPDGITENRRIDLSAPGSIGVACGDFNGDGRCDIAFIIENGRLRIYYQTDIGFLRDGYVDLEIDMTYINAMDIDGDGCCDLYCRTRDGQWCVLWGGKDGIRAQARTITGEKTDDSIFETLEFGGGNLRYAEAARPKILSIDGRIHLLFCTKEKAMLQVLSDSAAAVTERTFETVRIFDIPGVISAASGDIDGDGRDDLVFLSRGGSGEKEKAYILFGGERDFSLSDAVTLQTKTARDVVIADFSGNGHGDIAICQGRDEQKFSTESLVYASGKGGIDQEPKRFSTHNAVGVLAADTDRKGPQLVFVNQQQSDAYGNIPVYIYTGDRDGYNPDRRVLLPGFSPSSIIPADFDDDGFTDILLINNGEDQPHRLPPSSIFPGGPDGLDPDRKIDIPTYLSWGAQAGDINRDGYLDILFTSNCWNPEYNRNIMTILYGSAQGYHIDNSVTFEFAPPDDPCGIIWPQLADYNNDGWLDICLPFSSKCYSLILWGGPEGYSMERSQKLPVESAVTVRAADLTGNGWLDLVFGTRTSKYKNKGQEGSVVIFWGGPEGYSSSRCCELPSYQTNCITIADLDNDGFLDIFASSYFNGKERDVNSFIYWNDKGHFSVTNRKRFFSHSSSAALACDLNEDGYVDLIVSHHRAYGSHRTESAIWWNGPEGFDEKYRTFLPSLGPHDMVAVDVGNIMDRGSEEFYTSPVIKLHSGAALQKIAWEAEIPWKTWVTVKIRVSETEEGLRDKAFTGPDGTGKTCYHNGEAIPGTESCTYVQYRLALGAVNSINTPRVTKITLEY